MWGSLRLSAINDVILLYIVVTIGALSSTVLYFIVDCLFKIKFESTLCYQNDILFWLEHKRNSPIILRMLSAALSITNLPNMSSSNTDLFC